MSISCSVNPAVRIHKVLADIRSCENQTIPNRFLDVADRLTEQNCFDIQDKRFPSQLEYFRCVAEAHDNAVSGRDLGLVYCL